MLDFAVHMQRQFEVKILAPLVSILAYYENPS